MLKTMIVALAALTATTVLANNEECHWVEVSSNTVEANTPTEIAGVLNRSPDAFRHEKMKAAGRLLAGAKPKVISQLSITDYVWRWTGPTTCAANDPRLEQRGTSESICWKQSGDGSTTCQSSSMPVPYCEDPCAPPEEGAHK